VAVHVEIHLRGVLGIFLPSLGDKDSWVGSARMG
jgi:hypothetical protein